jgi:hypothetical protein
LFVVAIIALHVLDPELSVVNEYMSVYALGDYGWLERLGSAALGLGTIAIALGLRDTLAAGQRVAASWILIAVAGLGFLASALFVTDPTGTTAYTISGAIHDLSGLVGLPSLLIASWMLRGVFARDDQYRHLAGTELWFAVLLTVATVILFATPATGLPVGLTQRAFFVVVVTWLFVLAANIRRMRTSSRGSDSTRPVAA